MNTDSIGATSADILRLVERALEEIDLVEIDVTIRRAVRVASLLGDTHSAIRLGLEIKPSGGHPQSNAEMTRRLMADPSLWGAPGGVAESAIEQYIAERTVRDEMIDTSSIAEMRFHIAERFPRDQLNPKQYEQDLTTRSRTLGQLERARHHAFTLFCRWERQLTFSAIQNDALAAVRDRVDGLLANSAQDVLETFNVAFRRLREVAEATSTASAGELLSQAVTSCRRILKAIVDKVEPFSPSRPVSAKGNALTDDAYKNRLVEFLLRSVRSNSFRGALIDDGESLFKRFASVDAMASKGVHARLAAEEAEFCALHTYLLAGEILLINESAATSDDETELPSGAHE